MSKEHEDERQGTLPECEKFAKKDNINPNHYTNMKIAPNVYITENKLEWEVANVVKYVSRYKNKNEKEDLLKAIKYIELLIEREYGDKK